jgi:uncharacterized protein (DUF58 family)
LTPAAVYAPPTPQELLKRVRLLDLATRTTVNQVLAGAYHSIFKGMGVEFAEVRPYMRGDDIRTIDWKVTARTGGLHVKRYHEERELSVILAVDVSSSMRFGSGTQSKAELAAEAAALLAFSAIKNNDRVGLLMFSDRCETYVPPRKGKQHGLRLITRLLGHPGQRVQTKVSAALEFLSRAVRRRSIVFLISDFLGPEFTQPLKIARRKHDCVAVIVSDAREHELPAQGWTVLADAELDQDLEIQTNNKSGQEHFRHLAETRSRKRRERFASQKVDAIELTTDIPIAQPLLAFFKQRARRIKR